MFDDLSALRLLTLGSKNRLGPPRANGQQRAWLRRSRQSGESIVGCGHFLQEDRGPELAQAVIDFMARSAWLRPEQSTAGPLITSH